MGQTITIGGNRVGSGKKMKAELHNYFRSTHNLSEKWASSMTSGILYPAMVKMAMRGDVFDIDINADCRTIPTQGPLFGSYKMQIDVYQCPLRLYQGILHNNPLAIGLRMAQVKLPKVAISDANLSAVGTSKMPQAFSNSSLAKYLGISGIGKGDNTLTSISRKFNAVPFLAYYDIFKTYYANKQEEVGYVVSAETAYNFGEIKRIYKNGYKQNGNEILWQYDQTSMIIEIRGRDLQIGNIYLETVATDGDQEYNRFLTQYIDDNIAELIYESGERITFKLGQCNFTDETNAKTTITYINVTGDEYKKITLNEFNLSNIDDMRYRLLCSNQLGDEVVIGATDGVTEVLPYAAITGKSADNRSKNTLPLNGLVLKTYQNDLFNNWLNKDWIEGENSITEMSKVQIDANGTFSMDALNFAQKLYNMLNRIAVSGNTYEDWQDVVYEEVKRKQIESPIYLGGYSSEVIFDEVVQTAPADGDPLGTLGGRGRGAGKKGGKIHVKVDEASVIMAIVSLTPRIMYTQGNEWYMTELDSLDDLHKPALDGIGFQDLLGERLAWNDATKLPLLPGYSRSKIGKVPAWIEYMTSYDRAYGDFAELDGKGYMILNRNYEMDENGDIKDVTTYVDPTKYNYAFAYTELEAQNFWVEIGFNITARRLMSARLIPSI